MEKFTVQLSLLLLVSGVSQAGINLTDLRINNLGSDQVVTTESMLVYKDENNHLWSNQGSAKSSEPLLINDAMIEAGRLVSDNSAAYFINNTDNKSIYEFNGEQLVKSLNGSFVDLFKSVDGAIVAYQQSANTFYVIEGVSQEVYNLNDIEVSSNVSSFCRLSPNKALFKSSSSNQRGIYFFDHGDVSEINLNNESASLSSVSFELGFENTCYLKYYDTLDQQYKYSLVQSDGSSEAIESGDSEIKKIGVFMDKVIIQAESAVSVLNGSQPTTFFEADEALGGFWSGAEKLYLLADEDPCFPTPCSDFNFGREGELLVFDSEFHQVSTLPISLTFDSSVLFQSLSSDYFISFSETNNFSVIDTDQSFSTMSNPSIIPFKFVGGFNNESYLVGVNHPDTKPKVFKLSEKASMSPQMNGLWYNTELEGQGLSLHTGLRNDGTMFLFASLYAYKDGKPFWLAGTVDLDSGQNSQEIPVFEFEGNSFLFDESEEFNNETPFGFIEVQAISCDSLVLITHFDNVISEEIELQRIKNTRNQNKCKN